MIKSRVPNVISVSLTQAATVVAAENFVLQIIPKNMNNNITDNGTPNNHIIIIRVMNQTFAVVSQEEESTRGQVSPAVDCLFSTFHATATED